MLAVNPVSLDFGVGLPQVQITINNIGGGTLSIAGVTEDCGGWLGVTANSVNSNSLGGYTVMVNRIGLAQGIYNATITVNSTTGSGNIPVVMRVFSATVSDHAGY